METVNRGYHSSGGSSVAEYFGHFDKPEIDYSISKIYYEEYLPINTIEKNLTKIEFNIPASPAFSNLSQTTLELTFHLLLADGSKIPAAPVPKEGEKDVYKGAGTINYPIGG